MASLITPTGLAYVGPYLIDLVRTPCAVKKGSRTNRLPAEERPSEKRSSLSLYMASGEDE